MESIYEAFGYPRPVVTTATPDAMLAWSAEMVLASKADARDLIDEAPVRFMFVEYVKNYSTRLLV